jgi:hypothetical protein
MAVKMYRCGDPLFMKSCELAETTPTVRQWKKWRRRKGKAYGKKDAAKRDMDEEAIRQSEPV